MKNLIILSVLLLLFTGCSKEAPKAEILCGTTMIESMVLDLVPEAATALMVPPNACPGSFDMKPGDAKAAASAKVFIIHPFQQYLIEKVKKLNKKIIIETVAAKDLNLPGNYEKGLMETQEIIMKYFAGRQSEFDNRRQLITRNMEYLMKKDLGFRKKIRMSKTAVICSVFQASFAQYCGFEVVSTFAGPDSMSAGELSKIAGTARGRKVKFMISNMTGDHGVTAGIINKELKVKKIDLINFPLERGGGGFFRMYDYNMLKITENVGE